MAIGFFLSMYPAQDFERLLYSGFSLVFCSFHKKVYTKLQSIELLYGQLQFCLVISENIILRLLLSPPCSIDHFGQTKCYKIISFNENKCSNRHKFAIDAIDGIGDW